MYRSLNVSKVFARIAAGSFATGRIWGVARPRIRHTEAEVRAWARAAFARLPFWNTLVTSGRTSCRSELGARVHRAEEARRLARLKRMLGNGRTTVVGDFHSIDYEKIELKAFGEMVDSTRFLAQGVTARQWAKSMAFAAPVLYPGALRPFQYAGLSGDLLDEEWGTALDSKKTMAMARPNDWRESVLRRAIEGGSFDELHGRHFYRGAKDRNFQRDVAERIRDVTGRTLHRKSWKAAANFVEQMAAYAKSSVGTTLVVTPRLRWDDAADERARRDAEGATA